MAILVLALLMDAILVLLERLLTPWERSAKGRGPQATGGGAGEPVGAARRLIEPKTGGGNA
jgi:osmoprotectant transport system permease protein